MPPKDFTDLDTLDLVHAGISSAKQIASTQDTIRAAQKLVTDSEKTIEESRNLLAQVDRTLD